MASYNRVVLMGNLARDPDLRYTPSGNLPVVRTAIAVNRKFKDKEEVMFIDLVIFGKSAETLKSYATKGTQVLVEGRLSQNTWEQDGQKRFKHEIIVDNFQLMGSRHDRDESSTGGEYGSFPSKGSADERSTGGKADQFAFPGDTAEDDDDIPF